MSEDSSFYFFYLEGMRRGIYDDTRFDDGRMEWFGYIPHTVDFTLHLVYTPGLEAWAESYFKPLSSFLIMPSHNPLILPWLTFLCNAKALHSAPNYRAPFPSLPFPSPPPSSEPHPTVQKPTATPLYHRLNLPRNDAHLGPRRNGFVSPAGASVWTTKFASEGTKCQRRRKQTCDQQTRPDFAFVTLSWLNVTLS